MMPTGPRAADAYTDVSGLAQLKNQANSKSPEALKQTAQQFEGLFLQMAMKNMRQAGAPLEAHMTDSNASRMFRDMHDEQIATQMAKHSQLGFADMLVKQLGGAPAKTTATGVGVRAAAKPAGMSLNDYRHSAVRVLATSRPPASASAGGAPAAARKFMPLNAAPAGQASGVRKTRGFADGHEFFRELLPQAETAARTLGVDPKLLLSQVAVETGWGKHTPRRGDGSDSHNLFGIKAGSNWRGPRVANSTLEYEQGIPVRKIDHFRAYGSYQESFHDYVGLLRDNPRYAHALEHAHDPKQYMASLQKAGYATDPNYANKVMSVYRQWRDFDADAPLMAADEKPAAGAGAV